MCAPFTSCVLTGVSAQQVRNRDLDEGHKKCHLCRAAAASSLMIYVIRQALCLNPTLNREEYSPELHHAVK